MVVPSDPINGSICNPDTVSSSRPSCQFWIGIPYYQLPLMEKRLSTAPCPAPAGKNAAVCPSPQGATQLARTQDPSGNFKGGGLRRSHAWKSSGPLLYLSSYSSAMNLLPQVGGLVPISESFMTPTRTRHYLHPMFIIHFATCASPFT